MARLCVSQLGWQDPYNPGILSLLRAHDVQALEVTPSKICPDWPLMAHAADHGRVFADLMQRDHGFSISAFQAIYYGVDGLHVFDPYEARLALCDHTERVARLAAAMGARVLVFGAPRLRDPGGRDPEDAMTHAVPVFRSLARVCHENGVVLGIEANPAAYGCRFITHAEDAVTLVERVEHPGLRVHLDTGGMIMNGEDIPAFIARHGHLICHVHISEPHLADFDQPFSGHANIARALSRHGYGGDVSIELLARSEDVNPVKKMDIALRFVHAHYGILLNQGVAA